jgi:RHS repeat-associated protein
MGEGTRFHAVVTDPAGVPVELVDRDGTLSWHDRESGLHYNFYRYHNPVEARYVTADPLGLEAAVNQDSYVSNPTGWVGPLGHSAQCSSDFRASLAVFSGKTSVHCGLSGDGTWAESVKSLPLAGCTGLWSSPMRALSCMPVLGFPCLEVQRRDSKPS